jgi:ribosomal protein S27E
MALTVGQKYQKEMKKNFKFKRKIYCLVCEKDTKFVYDKGTKHSKCDVCGNSYKKIPAFIEDIK